MVGLGGDVSHRDRYSVVDCEVALDLYYKRNGTSSYLGLLGGRKPVITPLTLTELLVRFSSRLYAGGQTPVDTSLEQNLGQLKAIFVIFPMSEELAIQCGVSCCPNTGGSRSTSPVRNVMNAAVCNMEKLKLVTVDRLGHLGLMPQEDILSLG